MKCLRSVKILVHTSLTLRQALHFHRGNSKSCNQGSWGIKLIHLSSKCYFCTKYVEIIFQYFLLYLLINNVSLELSYCINTNQYWWLLLTLKNTLLWRIYSSFSWNIIWLIDRKSKKNRKRVPCPLNLTLSRSVKTKD